jgi:phenylpropionate dioxygenase-like ring-hydroxylating dioxygenase large terminal subunit
MDELAPTSPSSGHWYAVVSSRELGRRPLAKTRFSERLVFWRDAAGRPACVADRCAHRGAALSLGEVRDGEIVCPFHGLRYAPDGRCTRAPTEGAWPVPETLCVARHTVREGDGMVWLWRGPAARPDRLPPVPQLSLVAGLPWGEVTWTWPAHYTRCVESVIDFSHLPFVHRRSLGLFIRNPACRVTTEPWPGGFRARRVADSMDRQFVEFLYPNVWMNRIGSTYVLAALFAPVDERTTEAYLRWYYPPSLRALRPLVDLWGRFSQWLVFADDLPILATPDPRNVDDAGDERLLPSDAPQVLYRRLRRQHQQELR